MSRKLYLFPDTNIFLQCKPLDQVNFKEITDCDVIEVIITRPVQQEIDRQKGQGNTRLSKKAKTTASLFKRIIQAEGRVLCLKDSSPRVTIKMDVQLRPDDALAQFLNYQEADDQFVGIASGFAIPDNGDEKAIITCDSGPMISAITHEIQCPEVPDSWMLMPETDEQAKKIAQLEKELKKHTEARPLFAINTDTVDWDGRHFNFTSYIYSPLTEDEVARLKSKLSSAIPLVTNFTEGKPETASSGVLSSAMRAMLDEVYEEASEKDIASYQIQYPQWLNDCEEILRTLHNSLNPQCFKHPLCFFVSNLGHAIAERAEISFSASGTFGLGDSTWKLDKMRTEPDNVTFPKSPAVPKGKWVNRYGVDPMSYARALAIPAMEFRQPQMPVPLNGYRNKNGFYYLAENRNMPVKSFAFECEEWRHQDKDESFPINAFFPAEIGEKSGSVEVRIHANNLLEPIVKIYPVRIAVYEASPYSYAENLIEDFITHKKFNKKLNL